MSEHEFEAIRGLPGDLPEGETVLWQGAPDWFLLAIDAFKIHWVGAYFAMLFLWRFVDKLLKGTEPLEAFTVAYSVMPLVLIALSILGLLAWINARSTVYTITNKRIVMRFGAALTKAINIPYKIIESASAQIKSNGSGTVAVKLVAPNKIPLLLLWPHRRPGTFAKPEPAFRSLKDGSVCAPILAEALRIDHEQARATIAETDTILDNVSNSEQPILA